MVDTIRRAAEARKVRSTTDLPEHRPAAAENAALRDTLRTALAQLFHTGRETVLKGPKGLGRIARPGSRRSPATDLAKPPELRGLPAARLRKVMAHIDASLGERLDVPSLAGVAGMSPGYFTAMFKRATGVTPHEAVTRRRLARSQELLADESLTVAEIGYQLGFSSHAHFCTAFRRRVGLSPSAWRAEQRGRPVYRREQPTFSVNSKSSS